MRQAHHFATLIEAFEHWVHTRPHEVFMTQPYTATSVRQFTWAQVADQVYRVAAWIKAQGYPEGSNIAIVGKNSAHWIMSDLAIWMAGHVSVPIYPTASGETVRYVVEHSEAKLLIVGKLDELWPVVARGVPEDLPCLRLPLSPDCRGTEWEEIVATASPISQPARRKPDELATILYTSGSTGHPKGVMTSFGAMALAIDGVSQLFEVKTSDRMLSYLPLAHAAERAVVETGSIFFGFQVFFAYSLDTFVQDLQRARPTLFFSVPRFWTRFYNGINSKISPRVQQVLFRLPVLSGLFKRFILKKLGLSDVRVALSGSAPLSPALVSWYRGLGLELLEGYGMSENFAYSHFNRDGYCKVGTVGPSNPGVTTLITDDGEVWVKSPCTMMGYYKNPELTKEVLTEDMYLKTGDMGEVDADGFLRITGRVKDLFKTSKGKYIAPVPIENKLGGCEAVEAVCVTGPSFETPFALAMLSVAAQTAIAQDPAAKQQIQDELLELLKHTNEAIESHEQLSCIVVVKDQWTMDNGFLTPTMKIKRNIIESHYLPKAAKWVSLRQPVVWE